MPLATADATAAARRSSMKGFEESLGLIGLFSVNGLFIPATEKYIQNCT